MSKAAKVRKGKIRVLVADSTRMHTHLLTGALKHDHQFDVFPFEAEVPDLASTAAKLDVDVLLMSANVDDRPSLVFDALRQVCLRIPKLRAVVLIDTLSDDMVISAFRAGARGIFGKSQPVEELSKCIRCVHQGQIWANTREMSLAVEALANAPTVRTVNARGLNLLSKRELQVVHCLAEGLGNREIADRLRLSQHTVKNHLFRIFDKLGVSSRSELLSMALSQSSPPRSTEDESKNVPVRSGFRNEFALLQKAADAGLPAAQLALAQVYLARRASPRDGTRAYMWYLVALERAAQAKELLGKNLTADQIEEAQKEAQAKLAEPVSESSNAIEWSPTESTSES